MTVTVRRRPRPTRTTGGLAATWALLAALALTGCGSNQPTGPGGTPATPTASTVTSSAPTRSSAGSLSASQPSPSGPGATGSTPAVQTLTGRVQEGVESGCTVLVDDSGTVLANLIGFDPTGVDVTGEVVVTGSFNPDLMTTCQQGRPFEVTSVRAA